MSLVSETGLGSGAPALSGYHYRVMDALRRVLGDAPADWFHDAVRLSVPWAAPTLRASSYVVALLLQQIEERLRAVLLPLDFVSRSEYELRQQEIEEIVRVYELTPDDLQRWQRCRLSLERTISESLPTQDASDLLGEHAALFGSLLDAVTKHFDAVLRKIDVLPAEPDAATLRSVLHSLPESDVVQERLLKRLPAEGRYLEALRLAGFFRRPPKPVRDEKGAVRYHPSWPAAKYLTEVAGAFPAEVGAILNEIPRTHSYLVRVELAKAARRIPAPMKRAWLRREVSWFLQHQAKDDELENHLGEVACSLIEQGEVAEGCSLLRQLLEYPVPPADEMEKKERLADRRSRDWYARQILSSQLPKLIDKWPQQTFVLLCDVLQSVQRWHRREGSDYLSFSRRQIAAQGVRDSWDDDRFENQVVNRALAAAEQWASSDGLPAVLEALRSRPGDFFRRVVLHMLRSHPDPQLAKTVREELLDEHAFTDGHLDPEYSDLLAAQFGTLSQAEQGRVWGWLQKGPPAAELERLRAIVRPEEQTAELDEHVQRWRYRWMQRLQGCLPATLSREFEHLTSKYRPAKSETVPRLIEPKELLGLDEKTLIERLQEASFTATGRRGYEPTQADKLREAVLQDPKRFVERPGMFHKLRAEYQGAFFEGLYSAIPQHGPATDTPLSLSRTVLLAKDLLQKASPDERQHIDLGIAHVLYAALVRRERPLVSIAEFDTVFAVLEALLRRQPPEYRGRVNGRLDYPMMLLNTPRGLALSSLFAAAIWKKRDLVQHGTTDITLNTIYPGCGGMLAALLSEGDPLVHASMGERFWSVCYLDESWLQENIERVLPREQNKRTQFSAAWSMYLTESRSVPDANWLALLRPYYDHALLLRGQQLAEQPGGVTEKREEVSDHALASHLGALYLYGLLNLAAGDLLDRYYAQADDDGAASVVGVFLHQLRREGQTRGRAQQAAADEEPTEKLVEWVDRARALWAWRKATVLASPEPDQHGKEAAAFAHLFLLVCFEGAECLAVLEDLLPIADLNAWDSALLERLAALATEAPAACLRVASGFIYRGGYPQHDSTSKVLRAALQGGDKQVQRDARELLNRLLAGGCAGLDDLLALDATPPSSDESAAATSPTADSPE